MPDFGDIDGLPPVTLDPSADLGSLAWPWDQPMPPPPGAAVIPGAVDVAAAAPSLPDAATPDGALVVPSGAPPAPLGEPPPAAPLGETQPGLGVPRSVLDALVQPAAAPPGPSPDFAAAPPIVAAPAVEQPLTPAAGATAFGEPLPPADAAGLAPAPLGEPGLPPAPTPLAPAPVFLPGVEPITGRLDGTGESFTAAPADASAAAEQRYAAVAGEYHRDPNKLLDRLEQPGALDPDTQRYLDEFAARDQPGAAVLRQRLIDAGTMRGAAARLKMEQDNFDRQKANVDRLKAARAEAAKKSAEIDAEATKIAETKIGYHPSTLQRIAGVIAAVVGGLYQGRTGSARNPGLDALNDVINRDLEEQKLNLANRRDVLQQRRSALGELTARSNDEYQSSEIMRLAALKYADEQLAQQQLNFAPDGTRGLNLSMMRAGLNAQMAANKEAHDGKLFEQADKVIKAKQEQDKIDDARWKNRQDVAIAWTKEGREAGKDKADNTVLTPTQIQQQFPAFPVSAIPPLGLTVADATKRNELYNKGLETTQKTTANAMQQAGTQVQGPDGTSLTQDGKPTGKPVVMASHEIADKLNEKVASAQNLVDALGRARRFIDAGPSSIDRAGYAKVTTDLENAKVAYIEQHGAKPSSREMQAVEELFGPNFDGYAQRLKDKGVAKAHIDAIVEDAKLRTATELRQKAKYTGPSVIVDTSQPSQPRSTPEDRNLELVLAPSLDLQTGTRGARERFGDRYEVPDSNESVIGSKQRKVLDDWHRDIQGPDPVERAQLTADLERPADDSLHIKAAQRLQEAEAARNRALEYLTDAANRSNNYGINVYARRLLFDTIAQGIDATPGAQ